jgi:hypothetical protein
VETLNWAGLALVVTVLALTGVAGALVRTEDPPAPADDPTRNPNWCWTHSQIWPACAPQHEEQS